MMDFNVFKCKCTHAYKINLMFLNINCTVDPLLQNNLFIICSTKKYFLYYTVSFEHLHFRIGKLKDER